MDRYMLRVVDCQTLLMTQRISVNVLFSEICVGSFCRRRGDGGFPRFILISSIPISSVPILSIFFFFFYNFSHFVYSCSPILSTEGFITPVQPIQEHNGSINLYHILWKTWHSGKATILDPDQT